MKIYKYMIYAGFAMAAAVSSMACTAIANTSNSNDSLRFSVGLETPKSFPLGAPIILRCSFTNTDPAHYLAATLGDYCDNWYTFSLTDATGHVLAEVPGRLEHPFSSITSGPLKNVAPKDTFVDYICIANWISGLQTGTYRLTFKYAFKYSTVGQVPAIGPASVSQIEDSGMYKSEVNNFMIQVGEPDPSAGANEASYIERKAATLGELYRSEEAQPLIDALFTLSEQEAAESWQKIAAVPDLASQVADALGNHPSLESVDLLDAMQQNTRLPTSGRTEASYNLNKLRLSTNPAIQAHVKDLARQEGVSLPDNPSELLVPGGGID